MSTLAAGGLSSVPNSLNRRRLKRLKDAQNPNAPPPRKKVLNCPDCASTNIVEFDNYSACAVCGTQINDANIVAEVAFGESSAGAAIVQGGFVAEGQRNARTAGIGFRLAGARESREVTESVGREEIRKLTETLRLNDHVKDQAFQLYKLAIINSFVQGRRTATVAATCIYTACRRDENNTTLLIDLAEAISVNVYKLGDTYKALKKLLFIEDSETDNTTAYIEVENLIMKYADKMDFGQETLRVADDANKIIRRMKRDWIVTGRHPGGLCGAALILAARMNNFRRSVREVVYVVKVCDVIVQKRMLEFNETISGSMTVDQFREYSEKLKTQADPPILIEQRKAKAKKRKLELLQQAHDSTDGSRPDPPAAESISTEVTASRPTKRRRTRPTHGAASADAGSTAGSARVEATQTRKRKRRVDADGFTIPAAPESSSTERESRQSRSTSASPSEASTAGNNEITEDDSRKRKKKTARSKEKRKPFEPTQQDLAEEDLLEEEILGVMRYEAPGEEELKEIEQRSKELAERTVVDERAASSRRRSNDGQTQGRAASNTEASTGLDAVEIGEEEFLDDAEVKNCILTQEEAEIKEKIWVSENEDWLRARQAKMLRKTLEEADGEQRKRKYRKHKKGRLGDGSVLEGISEENLTPESATRAMLEKQRGRKGITKGIDYDRILSYYKIDGNKSTTTGSAASNADADSARDSDGSEEDEEEEEEAGADTRGQGPGGKTGVAAAEGDENEAGEEADADADAVEEDEYDEEDEGEEQYDEAADALRSVGIDEDDWGEPDEIGFEEEYDNDYDEY